jgi:hypothetical protein
LVVNALADGDVGVVADKEEADDLGESTPGKVALLLDSGEKDSPVTTLAAKTEIWASGFKSLIADVW